MTPVASICAACRERPATDRHHKFHQTAWARRLYGDFLDDARNIQLVCNTCHASHRSTELIHWGELEFCAALGIAPRSKVNRGKK